MKKIFFICLLLACACFAKAQNNLQFNKGVLLTVDSMYNCSGTCPDTILLRAIVVPAGKMLKIESINFIATVSTYTLYFNGIPMLKNGYTRGANQNAFPVWLPQGSYNVYFATYDNSAPISGQHAYMVSGLEFNIVP
jgi:hypothetical protein